MPTVTLKVSAEDRELWVEAAGKEGVSLSEWLRQAAATRLLVIEFATERLSSGEAGAVATQPERSGQPVSPELSRAGQELIDAWTDQGVTEPTEHDLAEGLQVADKLGLRGAEETEDPTSPVIGSPASAPPTETGEVEKATSPTGPGDSSAPLSEPSAPVSVTDDQVAKTAAIAAARALLQSAPGKRDYTPDPKPERKPKKSR